MPDGGVLGNWSEWPHPDGDIGRATLGDLKSPGVFNPGLLFDKFAGTLARFEYANALAGWRQRQKGKKPEIKDQKGAVLRTIAGAYERWATGAEKGLLRAIEARREAATGAFARSGIDCLLSVRAHLRWRLTSRLGQSHPFETGFMFHPLFGLPFLPGSGFKGAVRFAYWARYVAEAPQGEADTSRDVMRWLFGSDDPPLRSKRDDDEDGKGEEHRKGIATFLDVFPPPDALLEVDLLNPHYPGWYQAKAQETDDQNPVPTFFLTVASKSPWMFQAVLNPVRSGLSAEDLAECRARLTASVHDALTVWGLGAKTAGGYGLFEIAAGDRSEDRSAPAGSEVARPDGSRGAAAQSPVPRSSPSIEIEDPLLARIRAFRASDLGQLRQLVDEIEKRPNSAELLARLAARLLEVCGSDKKRLKEIRRTYPSLAPHFGDG